MYIWLKDGAEKELKDLKEQGLFGNVRVETHRTGKKYFTFYEDVIDLVSDVNFPKELIERVTFKDKIYRGFRTEGVYGHEGAALMVRTMSRVHSEMNGDAIHEEWQEISIAAPSVEQLKTIYTLVRQGKLAPEENWEERQCKLAPEENWEERPIAPSWFSRLWSWLRAR